MTCWAGSHRPGNFLGAAKNREPVPRNAAPPKTFMLAPKPSLGPKTPRVLATSLPKPRRVRRGGVFLWQTSNARSQPLRRRFRAHRHERACSRAPLGHVTVRSLTKVTALLRGPQYATISTSSSLHSALHVAAWQLERMTRTALSPAAEAPGQGGPGGPCSP